VAPQPAEEQLFGGDDIPGDDSRDNIGDYIGFLQYEAK
jgi:hypothetical protein